MAHLRQIVESIGASDVSTYIASGNVLCRPPGDVEAFGTALEQAIEHEYGFYREVISRTRDDVRRTLDEHPFDVSNPKFSYVSFMRGTPTREAVEQAQAYPTGDDRWQVIKDNLHIRYADGAGRPQMPAPAIMRTLAVPTTARNLATVRKLVELAG